MATADDKHLECVGIFLKKYYYAQAHDVTAAGDAMLDMMGAERDRYQLRMSFRHVLKESYPDGALRDLVKSAANRDVADDHEAKGFLWKVYNMNVLDFAPSVDDNQKD